MAALPIQLDRARRTPLAAQIYSAIREGIENGRLASGARLPSWQDLAAQLGVSRGTVRVAYERLIAEQFAIGLGPREVVWPSCSPDPQYLSGRRKPRFCRTSSTSSEMRRRHFRWACPLKTANRNLDCEGR
jgi:DNA-binding transcriptional MocR family regulator